MFITNDYEAYVFVRNHLLTQGESAKNNSEDCLYRGYKGDTLMATMELAEQRSLEMGELDYEFIHDMFDDLVQEVKPDAMCAVGCLILDDFYHQNMEGQAIEYGEDVWDAVKKSNPAWKMTMNSWALLKELQTIHDSYSFASWESSLDFIGERFNKYNDFKGEPR